MRKRWVIRVCMQENRTNLKPFWAMEKAGRPVLTSEQMHHIEDTFKRKMHKQTRFFHSDIYTL
ncbi:MAG TPA: hypothetical protein DCR31_04595 [Ruminococcaceae bacterium]|nr:hypothetical protein [Oscillospiraceae bacterium]